MTPKDADARERRAAARERRRSSADAPEPNGDGGLHPGDALKSAASAAAVGAAVGAARALSSRRRHAGDEETTADRPRDEQPEPEPEAEAQPEAEPEPKAEPEPAAPADIHALVRQARALFRDLHGSDAESVSSVAPAARGWTVGLEVVEVRRIPDSTDVLATYEVELDGDGGLVRFERTRRYHRSEADRSGRR